MHYTAPHAPWRKHEQPADIWASYDGCAFESMPVESPHPWGGWNPTPEKRRETIQGYFTTITAMDRAIGRIIDSLETLDLRRDTLVFFLSDNGYNIGHHGICGKGNGTSPQNMYDESVKVPFNSVDDVGTADVLTDMRGRLNGWFARYVRPDRDGATLPVTGRGQIDLAEADTAGKSSFVGK